MEYDFIIIGAGSAGCVLADRLSECGRHTVLVLEAGGTDARFWIKVPVGYGFTYADPRVNWGYHAEADPGLNNRVAYWPRGRVIGGSSSINAMAYMRGLPVDFEDWDRAGAVGWGWENVRRAYERLECHWDRGSDGTLRMRGAGKLHVSDLRDQMHPFSRRFLEAASDLGWPCLQDLNDSASDGLSYYRSTVRKGLRWSSADAFLRPARTRPNVKLISKALVERIEIEEGRATGVRYSVNGQSVVARAAGEVLLSAGAINSPQILQLSGVGPGKLLQSHGIKLCQPLEQVGEGLQDHLAITHHFAAKEHTLNASLGHWRGRLSAGVKYLLSRKGPLSVPVNQVGGFMRSDPDLDGPDMQVYCNPASYRTGDDGRPRMGPDPGFILSVQPCRPTSRGRVHITSADPRQAPVIYPNSLSTRKDREDAVRACKLLRKLANTPTLSRVTKAAIAPDLNGMNEDDMLNNFRARAGTVFHPTCTCRMGEDAENSVLDARLRVHGLRGLRVVDASSFPNVTSGNTNAPVMMLAMRAADLILEDARSGA